MGTGNNFAGVKTFSSSKVHLELDSATLRINGDVCGIRDLMATKGERGPLIKKKSKITASTLTFFSRWTSALKFRVPFFALEKKRPVVKVTA